MTSQYQNGVQQTFMRILYIHRRRIERRYVSISIECAGTACKPMRVRGLHFNVISCLNISLTSSFGKANEAEEFMHYSSHPKYWQNNQNFHV